MRDSLGFNVIQSMALLCQLDWYPQVQSCSADLVGPTRMTHSWTKLNWRMPTLTYALVRYMDSGEANVTLPDLAPCPASPVDIACTLSLPLTLDVSPRDRNVDTNEATVLDASTKTTFPNVTTGDHWPCAMSNSNSSTEIWCSNRGLKPPLCWASSPEKD